MGDSCLLSCKTFERNDMCAYDRSSFAVTRWTHLLYNVMERRSVLSSGFLVNIYPWFDLPKSIAQPRHDPVLSEMFFSSETFWCHVHPVKSKCPKVLPSSLRPQFLRVLDLVYFIPGLKMTIPETPSSVMLLFVFNSIFHYLGKVQLW